MLRGEGSAKGAAQTITIQAYGNLVIAAPASHFVNPGHDSFGSLQRAFSRRGPFHIQTGYRARAPANLHVSAS